MSEDLPKSVYGFNKNMSDYQEKLVNVTVNGMLAKNWKRGVASIDLRGEACEHMRIRPQAGSIYKIGIVVLVMPLSSPRVSSS